MKILDLLFKPKDESHSWTNIRMRAIADRPIGPRHPSGMFSQHNPLDKPVRKG